jgi:hypothetical protein
MSGARLVRWVLLGSLLAGCHEGQGAGDAAADAVYDPAKHLPDLCAQPPFTCHRQTDGGTCAMSVPKCLTGSWFCPVGTAQGDCPAAPDAGRD